MSGLKYLVNDFMHMRNCPAIRVYEWVEITEALYHGSIADPAIRVYEWVEITEALYHGSIADPAIRVYEWVEILICCY